MADSANAIDIVVQNSVDPQIAPRLITIADGADKAALKIGSLKAQLDSLKSSGLGGLLSLLASAGGSTSALVRETEGLIAKQKDAAASLNANASALARQAEQAKQATAAIKQQADASAIMAGKSDIEAAAYRQLAEATIEAKQAKAQLRELSQAIAGASVGEEQTTTLLAAAMIRQSEAVEQLRLAKFNLAEVSAYVNETSAQAIVDSELLVAAQASEAKAASDTAAALAAELTMQDAINEAVAVGAAEFESIIAEAVAYSEATQRLIAVHELSVAATRAQTEQEAIFGTTLAETTATLEAQGLVWMQTFDQRRAVTIEQVVEQDNLRLSTESLITADQRYEETQQLLASVIGEVTAATVLDTEAKVANTVATNKQSASLHGLTELQAASAISQVATGQSSRRAFENFLTKTLSLGPILKTIFPIIGGIAFIQVLNEAGTALYEFVRKALDAGHNTAIAFTGILEPIRKTTDSLIVVNDHLDATISKLEHKPTTNGAKTAIDEMQQAADKLDSSLQRVSNDLDKVLTKNRIGAVAALLSGQGATRDTEDAIRKQFENLDNARGKANDIVSAGVASNDPKKAAEAAAEASRIERAGIVSTINALNEQYNALKKIQVIHDTTFTDAGHLFAGAPNQTANLTATGLAAKIATQALREFDATQDNIVKSKRADELRDQSSGLRAENKLAAAQWKELEAAFVKYETSVVKSTGVKATAQQSLGFLVGKESSINPANSNKLQAKELPYRNQIASQTYGDEAVSKIADQAKNMNLYGTALKQTTELDRIFQEAQKKGYTLTEDQTALLLLNSDYVRQNIDLQTEKTKIQKDAIDVELKYGLALKGSEQVMAEHPELADAIVRDLNRLKIAHADMKDPLLEFNRGIENQRQLLGQYGDQLKVSQAVQALSEELRQKGIANYQQEAEAQRANIVLLMQQVRAQAANSDLYEQTLGTIERLTDAKKALNAATSAELSNEAKRSELLKVNNALNDKQLETGQATSQKSPFFGALTDYVKDFTTAGAAIKRVYSEVWKTVADGAADSIARAIVYADNLGAAFKDVARSAIAELISGLIKIGIQLLLVNVLAKAFHLKLPGDDDSKKGVADTAKSAALSIAALAVTTAASYAAGKLLEPLWWSVAEAVSLATFGVNAIPATAGIASVVAAGDVAKGHKDGGLISGPGTGRSDSVLSRLSNGEFVVNAAATSQNLGLLQSINGGSQSPQQAAPQTRSSVGTQMQMRFVIEDHTSGVKFQKVQIGADEMRIIARDAAEQSVHEHADRAVANAISQPNSKTSKALRTSTTARRVR